MMKESTVIYTSVTYRWSGIETMDSWTHPPALWFNILVRQQPFILQRRIKSFSRTATPMRNWQ